MYQYLCILYVVVLRISLISRLRAEPAQGRVCKSHDVGSSQKGHGRYLEEPTRYLGRGQKYMAAHEREAKATRGQALVPPRSQSSGPVEPTAARCK